MVSCTRLKAQYFFAALGELSVAVHVDGRARGCLSKRNEDSLPRKGGQEIKKTVVARSETKGDGLPLLSVTWRERSEGAQKFCG